METDVGKHRDSAKCTCERSNVIAVERTSDESKYEKKAHPHIEKPSIDVSCMFCLGKIKCRRFFMEAISWHRAKITNMK